VRQQVECYGSINFLLKLGVSRCSKASAKLTPAELSEGSLGEIQLAPLLSEDVVGSLLSTAINFRLHLDKHRAKNFN